MQTQHQFNILVADESHLSFAQIICDEMASSAQARGTGIAKRTPEYIQEKMREGKAVIAFNQDGIWAGFCYIETWSESSYVANSGLIVAPAFRKGNYSFEQLPLKKTKRSPALFQFSSSPSFFPPGPVLFQTQHSVLCPSAWE